MKWAGAEEGTDLRMTGFQEGEEVGGDLEAAELHRPEGLADDPGLLEGAEGGVDQDDPAPPDATKPAFSGKLFESEGLDSHLHTRLFRERRERRDRLFPLHPVILAIARIRPENAGLLSRVASFGGIDDP